MLFAAAAPATGALDEYLPLLLILLPTAAMALAGVAAGRLAGLSRGTLAALIAASAGLLAAGALE